MKKGKFFLLEIPLYNIDIAVSIGQKDQEVIKTIKSTYKAGSWEEVISPFWETSSLGRFSMLFPSGPALLRLRNFPTCADSRGTLAHEVFHAVYMILKSRGMKLSKKSEEAYTYLTGYITREIYKRL